MSFVVVVPGGGRAIRLGLRNLVTAIPRRGSDLTGEVFGCYPLALWIVCHCLPGNSIPNFANVRLGFLFENFAAGVGDGDVAGGFAGDGGSGLFVEVGDGANPEVGNEGVVVEVESAVLVADGLDEARAGRPVVAPYRFPIPDSRFPIPRGP